MVPKPCILGLELENVAEILGVDQGNKLIVCRRVWVIVSKENLNAHDALMCVNFVRKDFESRLNFEGIAEFRVEHHLPDSTQTAVGLAFDVCSTFQYEFGENCNFLEDDHLRQIHKQESNQIRAMLGPNCWL